MSRNRRESLYYNISIYQHLDSEARPQNTFDVMIGISWMPLKQVPMHKIDYIPTGGYKRKLVYRKTVSSYFNITIKKLTTYIDWKFYHFQYSDKNVNPIAHEGYFTYINHDLEWIVSVVEVEFDYHVGLGICRRAENRPYMVEYKKTRFAGYGPQFCDIKNPKNNISQSMLARIFPD
ncbi:hypothetical protein PV-S19_0347 [Pacmanvirus S19]|nr:hypothetical protein PV-S19_0347 [Pacmanvirus S19]